MSWWYTAPRRSVVVTGAWHGVGERLLDNLPYPAVTVDDQLRVVTSSLEARNGSGLDLNATIGQPCYSRSLAIDLGKGTPCHESCPFASWSSQPGWAFSRLLEVQTPVGKKTPVDCLLIRCLSPDGQTSSLCVRRELTQTTLAANYRAMQAVEAVTSAIQRAPHPGDALDEVFGIVMDAVRADSMEILRADEGDGSASISRRLRGDTEWTQEFRRAVMDVGFPHGSLKIPLVAARTWPRTATEPARAWYVAAPLVQHGNSVGALGVASKQPNFDLVGALRIMAAIAAPVSALVSQRRTSPAGAVSAAGSGIEAANGMAPLLRVYCLGPFRLVAGGKPVAEDSFHRTKSLALLKHLVANRERPIAREALSESLWPDVTAERSRTLFRVVLHSLRLSLVDRIGEQAVRSIVVSAAGKVHLQKNGVVWVDAEEFDRKTARAYLLLREGQTNDGIQEGMDAAKLYRGEYFEDEPDSGWCLVERQRLRQSFVDLLGTLGALLTEQRKWDEAIGIYRRILRVESGREEAHRALMRLLARTGRRDEALRQYELCRDFLAEELGVEPSGETRRAYEMLLANG